MSFIVLCTFDLKNATRQDYADAYSALEKIGLARVLANSSNGQTVIPTTSALGTYSGSSVQSVRDHVRTKVTEAFKARRLTSEIFVVVGENGTWGAATT